MFKHAAESEDSAQTNQPKFESERFRRKRTDNPTAGAFVSGRYPIHFHQRSNPIQLQQNLCV